MGDDVRATPCVVVVGGVVEVRLLCDVPASRRNWLHQSLTVIATAVSLGEEQGEGGQEGVKPHLLLASPLVPRRGVIFGVQCARFFSQACGTEDKEEIGRT